MLGLALAFSEILAFSLWRTPGIGSLAATFPALVSLAVASVLTIRYWCSGLAPSWRGFSRPSVPPFASSFTFAFATTTT